MNHSRLQPTYWHPILYQGNIALPWLRDCQRFLVQAQARHPHITVRFTGGEVTEWQDFPELVNWAHAQGVAVEFRSSAQCHQQLWHELMNSTTRVTMDFHPGLCAASVFLLNLDRALALQKPVTVTLNMTQEHWHELINLEQTIQGRGPGVTVARNLVFDDPVFNTQPTDYTEEQLQELTYQQRDMVLGDELTDYATLTLERKNGFRGWQCRAGLDQCIVDAWGRVFRSHCRYQGYMGKISDQQVSWPTQPMICGVDQCVNAFDIRAIKIQHDADQ